MFIHKKQKIFTEVKIVNEDLQIEDNHKSLIVDNTTNAKLPHQLASGGNGQGTIISYVLSNNDVSNQQTILRNASQSDERNDNILIESRNEFFNQAIDNIFQEDVIENKKRDNKYEYLYNIIAVIVCITFIIIVWLVLKFLFMDNTNMLYKDIKIENYNISSDNTYTNSEITLISKKNNKLLSYFTNKTIYKICDNKDKCTTVSHEYFKKQIYDETSVTKTKVKNINSILFDNLSEYKVKDNTKGITYYGDVKEVKIILN